MTFIQSLLSRMSPRLRRLVLLSPLLGASALGGCASSMDRIDTQASHIKRDRLEIGVSVPTKIGSVGIMVVNERAKKRFYDPYYQAEQMQMAWYSGDPKKVAEVERYLATHNAATDEVAYRLTLRLTWDSIHARVKEYYGTRPNSVALLEPRAVPFEPGGRDDGHYGYAALDIPGRFTPGSWYTIDFDGTNPDGIPAAAIAMVEIQLGQPLFKTIRNGRHVTNLKVSREHNYNDDMRYGYLRNKDLLSSVYATRNPLFSHLSYMIDADANQDPQVARLLHRSMYMIATFRPAARPQVVAKGPPRKLVPDTAEVAVGDAQQRKHAAAHVRTKRKVVPAVDRSTLVKPVEVATVTDAVPFYTTGLPGVVAWSQTEDWKNLFASANIRGLASDGLVNVTNPFVTTQFQMAMLPYTFESPTSADLFNGVQLRGTIAPSDIPGVVLYKADEKPVLRGTITDEPAIENRPKLELKGPAILVDNVGTGAVTFAKASLLDTSPIRLADQSRAAFGPALENGNDTPDDKVIVRPKRVWKQEDLLSNFRTASDDKGRSYNRRLETQQAQSVVNYMARQRVKAAPVLAVA